MICQELHFAASSELADSSEDLREVFFQPLSWSLRRPWGKHPQPRENVVKWDQALSNPQSLGETFPRHEQPSW